MRPIGNNYIPEENLKKKSRFTKCDAIKILETQNF